jgi:CRISPR-associated DxTHG motif protein
MALKIVKKNKSNVRKNPNIAVITILGMIDAQEAIYNCEMILSKELKPGSYKNMLPLIIENYKDKENTTIISLYTQDALEKQRNVVKDLDFDIEKNGQKIDDKDFNGIFNSINELLINEKYDEFIIDISHGFRHLPILATISMLINNFQNTNKIKYIYFAKELEPRKKYEILDLKEYLDIANMSFVLSAFDDNYTVANHIKSNRYKKLILSLNEFSNDIMALNLSNLFKTSLPTLSRELSIINNVAIRNIALELKDTLESDFKIQKKKYLTFYKLSKILLEKNYILLSLSLLYESIRTYIKTAIKKQQEIIVNKIENYYNDDLYKLGDFFSKLERRSYDRLKSEKDVITSLEYNKLQNSFNTVMTTPSLVKEIMHTRNDLSHANSKESFLQIKEKAQELLSRYEKQYNLEEKLI